MEIQGIFWILAGMMIVMIPAFFLFNHLYKNLNYERSRNRGLSSRYGKITEQFLPLLDMYPWNPDNFRFLGSPIDGVQFEGDQVILVEFKAANGKLSKNQRRIRDMVNEGRVSFEVIKVG